jgi:hypothetical protein
MTDKEAMKLALEALELVKWTNNLQVDEAIAALKERLAQRTEQSGWRKKQIDDAEEELEKKAVYSPFIVSELLRLSK